jgi:hypothetical protein
MHIGMVGMQITLQHQEEQEFTILLEISKKSQLQHEIQLLQVGMETVCNHTGAFLGQATPTVTV